MAVYNASVCHDHRFARLEGADIRAHRVGTPSDGSNIRGASYKQASARATTRDATKTMKRSAATGNVQTDRLGSKPPACTASARVQCEELFGDPKSGRFHAPGTGL